MVSINPNFSNQVTPNSTLKIGSNVPDVSDASQGTFQAPSTKCYAVYAGKGSPSRRCALIYSKDVRPGDVVIFDDGPYRRCVTPEGNFYFAKCEIRNRDFEDHRGDYRS